MASAITGRARPPLFTTGPATRGALAAAGALGATTGTTVHLPGVPTSAPAMSAVLAHELMHTRSPVRRPRFLLDGASGLLDDDERQALAAGRDQAAATGAGIVDSLPVGGGMGAVGEVATRAARAAVLEAAASPLAGGLPGLGGAGEDAASAVSGAGAAIGGAADAAHEAAGAGAGGAGTASAGAASGGAASGGAASGPGDTAGGLLNSGKTALDADQVVEIVERRLLREIERRGGRWAGMF